MAKTASLTPTVIKLVKEYGKDLVAKGIGWDKLIVFGSYAKGSQSEWSDIDVCVVSSQFSDSRFDNQRLLMHNRSKKFLQIEPHPFHTQELASEWDPLAAEIRKYGVEVSN